MSLNGLDDAKVQQAYDTASAEPGGWFLLKYASRDEIELLESGNGGLVDIRNAMADYEEPSPLYGFLKYRRRNVIVKYMPEGCSRLIQARAAVHFTAICDQFTPYSTTFEISSAKDLKDSKLSAACSLHTASGSSCSSSSSSLRRRRLNEIIEEEEEEERERKRQSVVKEEDRPTSSIYSDTEHEHSPRRASPERPAVLDPRQVAVAQETNFASTTSRAKSEFDRRIYATYTYGKPKVKLGPRPSLDTSKRPTTAGTFRPTAALPAGFKLFNRASKKGTAQGRDEGTPLASSAMDGAPIPRVPIPPTPKENALNLPPRPVTSSGASVKSFAPSVAASTKESKMTPEKARLMKAMQLREKKKMMSAATPDPAASSKTHTQAEEEEDPARTDSKAVTRVQTASIRRSVSNADSGVGLSTPTANSHPPSPTAASTSEIESTDETVQAAKEAYATDDDVDGNNGPQELPKAAKESGDQGYEKKELDSNKETQGEGLAIDVSHDKAPRDLVESRQIPESTSESTQSEVRESTESNQEKPQESSGEKGAQRPPLGVPLSRFSSHEQQKSPTEKLVTSPSLKSKFSVPDLTIPAESKQATPLSANPEIRLPASTSNKRKPVEPIRIDVDTKSTPHSESDDPLLDDDLLDELQSATVQEAKHITVSKSPITPVFPSSSPPKRYTQLSRAVSSPMRGPLLAPSDVSQSTARSVSSGGAAYLHKVTQQVTRQASNAGLQSKNTNLGSGISQRIKALEALNAGGDNGSASRAAAPSANFFNVRKPVTRDSSKSPSIAERANSMSRQTPSPEMSRAQTPETPVQHHGERSSSLANRLTMFEGQNAPRGRPESVQVTARIIRDTSKSVPSKSETPRDPADLSPLELKQSPLLVDVQRSPVVVDVPTSPVEAKPEVEEEPPAVEQPKETIQARRERKREAEEGDDNQARRRSSLSIMRDFIKDSISSSKSADNLAIMSPAANSIKSPQRPPSSHHNSSLTRRLSISSRRSSFNRERDNAPAMTPLSPPGVFTDGSEDEKPAGDKKKRASRFMRRLSSPFSLSGAGARKNVTANMTASITPVVAEEDAEQLAKIAAAVEQQLTASSPAITIWMGDVNVQFPDSLLWKRRSVCMDAQGSLFLSTVQQGANGRNGGKDKSKSGVAVKRYHMSDFRAPYIPDADVEELPNSVVLDFAGDGSCLQIACGDRAGQQHMLHVLQDAHRNQAAT
ncbi:hypothetical protein GGR56DRAFT_663960 [Xylariaceae sp. FL0804]|nr:hypothetical protein GGR56DRAFT_663960 [Xylariaceae sp. FL0804]